MKILITGGTGFIGQALCTFLQAQGYTLCVLTRQVARAKKRLRLENISFISNLSEIDPNAEFKGVINLAGAPLVRRWTAHAKNQIKSSRGKTLHRPTFLPLPAWVVKLIFGQMGKELLLAGPKVLPDQLQKQGFEFRHPQLEGALRI